MTSREGGLCPTEPQGPDRGAGEASEAIRVYWTEGGLCPTEPQGPRSRSRRSQRSDQGLLDRGRALPDRAAGPPIAEQAKPAKRSGSIGPLGLHQEDLG